jgi:two-component system chemotaxis sensor kinase CheA
MKENTLKTKKDELLRQLDESIRLIDGQQCEAVESILAAVRLLKIEMGINDISSLEKFLDELEFSLDMINYTPGRNLMEALICGEGFLRRSIDALLLDEAAEPDEAEMNDILAGIVTCHPDLTGSCESEETSVEISEDEEDELKPDTGPMISLEDKELLNDFIEESNDNLNAAEVALLKLEEEPESNEYINEIFRCFHTIKGNSSFLSLTDINELSHKSESLLDSARTGKVSFSGPCAAIAFESLDMLKEMMVRLKRSTTGTVYETPRELGALIKKLEKFNSQVEAGLITFSAPSAEHTRPSETVRPSPSSAVMEEEKEEREGNGKNAGGSDLKVKVSTKRMDNLIDAVGELVIASAMVFQEREIQETTNPRLGRNISQMGKIVRELQEMAMSLRMVSLKSTFQKMARIVRDLSLRSGVSVDFTFSGEDTELDRNVVEEIGNPLVHMVRNAVDHGIEPPGERKAAGKPEKGSVHLCSYQEGGSVVIKLTDDGRGLNREKILRKAVNVGLIKPDAELAERDIYNLIFEPGFSTADKVTDISGRGVGMDVVRKNIHNLRGRIEISSEFGKGTNFLIRLPLTLAIIDGVVVRVSNEKYIIPTLSIVESIRAKDEQLSTVVGRGEIFSIRGELLPLFRLHRLFGLDGAKEDPTEGLIVIISGDGGNCALLVDDLIGKQQVVIKSLDATFKQLEGISGAAIMGDGRVALILDPQRITRLSMAMN